MNGSLTLNVICQLLHSLEYHDMDDDLRSTALAFEMQMTTIYAIDHVHYRLVFDLDNDLGGNIDFRPHHNVFDALAYNSFDVASMSNHLIMMYNVYHYCYTNYYIGPTKSYDSIDPGNRW